MDSWKNVYETNIEQSAMKTQSFQEDHDGRCSSLMTLKDFLHAAPTELVNRSEDQQRGLIQKLLTGEIRGKL